MSDMSRPGSPSRAIDHEQHDALLVAQFVAGDPLEPERQAEAQHLLTGCAACAALAADLPAISHAVAQERVPPRRRDFRLSPEQAEDLHGNALTRFIRRSSLPRSRAFQPAAAGVLSIGLLFIVAGYAWPDGGTVMLSSETSVAGSQKTESAPVAATAQPDDQVAAPLPAADLDATSALEGAERAMEESGFADTLAESQAGRSENAKLRSADDEAPPEVEAFEPDAQQRSLATVDEDGEAALAATADAIEESAGDVTEAYAADAEEPDSEALAEDTSALRSSDATGTVAAGMDSNTTTAAVDDGPEELLLLLGLVLAFGGAGLLLLGWLARRARDPLAP